MNIDRFRKPLLASVVTLGLLFSGHGLAQQPQPPAADPATAAGDIANFFSQVGDQIYEDCIFELSEEQLEVQQALIKAYIKQGASSSLARQLAVKQIQPPNLSDKCQRIRGQAKAAPPTSISPPPAAKKATARATLPKGPSDAPTLLLADKKTLPQWDCAPGVDYVTIQHKGYERKLTGGEICNPFDDVVRNVPELIEKLPPWIHDKDRPPFCSRRRPATRWQDDRMGDLRQRSMPKQSRSRVLRCKSSWPPASGRILLRIGKRSKSKLGTEKQAHGRRHLPDEIIR